MDRRIDHIWVVILSLFLLAGCATRGTRGHERDAAAAQDMADEAAAVLEEFLAEEDGSVLKELIAHAKGMMIIPSESKVGFIVSFGGGSAVLMANTDAGWTGPVFMTKGAVGYGWQAGATSQSGIVLFMHEDDVRYVMETGAVLQGEARLVFLTTDYEINETPEYFESGDIYFVGEKSGLFAGVALDTGGYSDRPSLNEAFSGVEGGGPRAILYEKGIRPKGADRLRKLIDQASRDGALTKKKDGIEIPSN